MRFDYILFSLTASGMHPLKTKFSNFKCSTNYIKYSGLKKHVRQKPNLRRHQCEVCSKSFKNKLMKDFHKRMHLRQLSSKELGVKVNGGDNLKDESKIIKPGQLQKYLQSGKQLFEENYGMI